MNICIEVSAGELIDKLTILEIKSERIQDPAKRENIETEKQELAEAARPLFKADDAVERLAGDLKAVNERLWEIEDAIREHEAAGDFGSAFVDLARSVYITNDRRAALKRQVNEATGSRIIEEKSYSDYQRS